MSAQDKDAALEWLEERFEREMERLAEQEAAAIQHNDEAARVYSQELPGPR